MRPWRRHGRRTAGGAARERRDAPMRCAASRSAMRRLARRPQLPRGRARDRHRRHRRRRLGQFQSLDGRRVARRRAAACRWSSTATARYRAGPAVPTCSKCLGLPLPLDEKAARRLPRRQRVHVPVRAALPSVHERDRAGAPCARRAHGLQPARAADESRGAAVRFDRRVQPRRGAAHGRHARRACRSSASFVVHGEPGWDEPTPCGPFELYDVRPGRVRAHRARSCGLRLASCARRRNSPAAMPRTTPRGLRAVFAGEDRGPHRDAIVLNAALALELTGRVNDPSARHRGRGGRHRSRRRVHGCCDELAAFGAVAARRVGLSRRMGLLTDMHAEQPRSECSAAQARVPRRARCASRAARAAPAPKLTASPADST